MAKVKYSRLFFLRLVVVALSSVHIAALWVQQADVAPVWVSELTRFVPFYWFAVTLFGALIGGWFAGRFFCWAAVFNLFLFAIVTMDFHWSSPAEMPTDARLRVLTYNIKALNARRVVGGLRQLEAEVSGYSPDIVAIQDGQKWLVDGASPQVTPARATFGLPYVEAVDQFVLASRFPLVDCTAGRLDPSDEAVQYLECTTLMGATKLQIVTTHFISPRSSLTAAESVLAEGVGAWQHNLAHRLSQSRALLKIVATLPKPIIVMGDFNAVETSPVISTLKYAELSDAYALAGQGWGLTYGHALDWRVDLFRIDHILVSSDFVPLVAGVGNGGASEHNLVYADVQIAKSSPPVYSPVYR